MDAIYNLGINFIIAFQSLGSWLVTPMAFFSFFGSEQFFVFVLPVIFWCVDAEVGIRLGILLMASTSLNGVFKLAMHAPRPSWLSEQVKAFASQPGFGIPSGHSQNSVVTWGLLAARGQRRWMWWAAGTIAFLTGLSRMYLGMHFPGDVLGGWVIGIFLLWVTLKWIPGIASWHTQRKLGMQIFLAWFGSMSLILAGYVARLGLESWSVPIKWVNLAAQAKPIPTTIAPLALSPVVTPAAAMFGVALGAILLKPQGGFEAGGEPTQRVLRFIVGLVGVAILYAGLGALFPRGEDFLALAFRYVRYTIIAAWVSGFAPMLFIRMRLATPSESRKARIPT
jgi:membrane-associated phospholipid phosphatase